MKTYFHGVREHLICTPQGRVAFLQQIPGNRHDVNGLYALLKTSFKGSLLADAGYLPKKKKREQLEAHGIVVHALPRSNMKEQPCEYLKQWLKKRRGVIERRISLFDRQFHAHRTLNRSAKHYHARRWTKALAHNCSRHINDKKQFQFDSVAHFHAVA
jgi:DDE family transposase